MTVNMTVGNKEVSYLEAAFTATYLIFLYNAYMSLTLVSLRIWQ
jgi:hypothetical protein